jgi:hypothetical protein
MLQVRLPSKLVKNMRVLGVENVFDCLDLCLPIKDGMRLFPSYYTGSPSP